jgi:23S rRNA (adenine2503-C2)-methyltransferase
VLDPVTLGPAVTSPTGGGEKPSLVGLTRAGLAAALTAAGIADRQVKMRAGQIWNWIYLRGATDFAEMTNISKDLRSALAGTFALTRPEIVTEQISEDGTRKWLLRFPPRGAGRPAPRGGKRRSHFRVPSSEICSVTISGRPIR